MLQKLFNPIARSAKMLLLVLGLSGSAAGQTGIDTGLANALQNSIEYTRSLYNVKGISAAAYIPGKGMWKGVTGVSYGAVPIDTTMLFSIGSVTKTLVAAEIFKLIEGGLLSLSDTVGALLPAITNVNPSITVAQLLGHRSGMGEFLTSSWQAAMNADLSAIWYFPSTLPAFLPVPAGPPGSPWQYCNSNYNLLGMIIESKTSDSLHKVLRTNFLQPLGLANTHMEIFEPYANSIPHNWATPTMDPALATDASATPHEALWSSVEAAGGYFSDAADMAKWGYNLYSGNVLSATSLAQMLNYIPVSGGYFNGYGLGSMRFTNSGKTYYGHGGNYYGYAASMLYYPVDSICVAVLINQDCIATYEARMLMNVLINKLTTAITDLSQSSKISVHPNPACGSVQVTIGDLSDKAIITCADMTGKVVYKTETNAISNQINTSGFADGMYLVTIAQGAQVTTKQIIIKQ
jgi:D-alanyl-D-alanine carboxypeptidase